jgi:hypothetical protein
LPTFLGEDATKLSTVLGICFLSTTCRISAAILTVRSHGFAAHRRSRFRVGGIEIALVAGRKIARLLDAQMITRHRCQIVFQYGGCVSNFSTDR